MSLWWLTLSSFTNMEASTTSLTNFLSLFHQVWPHRVGLKIEIKLSEIQILPCRYRLDARLPFRSPASTFDSALLGGRSSGPIMQALKGMQPPWQLFSEFGPSLNRESLPAWTRKKWKRISAGHPHKLIHSTSKLTSFYTPVLSAMLITFHEDANLSSSYLLEWAYLIASGVFKLFKLFKLSKLLKLFNHPNHPSYPNYPSYSSHPSTHVSPFVEGMIEKIFNVYNEH